MKLYAGVGSRRTPPEICELMTRLAARLAGDGWTCRTGGAIGADEAFRHGAAERIELYLPWPKFNGQDHTSRVRLTSPNVEAYAIAEMLHPAWKQLEWKARALHGRNV